MSAMSIVTQKVSLTENTAKNLFGFDATRVQANIQSANGIYIGDQNVTTSDGFAVPTTGDFPIPTAGAQAEVWAICANAAFVTTVEFKAL